MKAILIIGAVALALVARAGTAFVVASFKSPATTPYGIDYHGGYVYHITQYANPYRIYETTTTGSITATIICEPRPGRAIDRTNTEFWTAGGHAIFKLTTTGSWLSTIPMPTEARGVSFDGRFLWFAGRNRYVYKVTTGGGIVTSFRVWARTRYVNPCGLCYHNAELYLIDTGVGAITQATVAGSFIESYHTARVPYGVTFEGNYVWYSDLESRWVYKAYLYSTNAVAPASLGRVKALYR